MTMDLYASTDGHASIVSLPTAGAAADGEQAKVLLRVKIVATADR
jgi:hypothetical protein